MLSQTSTKESHLAEAAAKGARWLLLLFTTHKNSWCSARDLSLVFDVHCDDNFDKYSAAMKYGWSDDFWNAAWKNDLARVKSLLPKESSQGDRGFILSEAARKGSNSVIRHLVVVGRFDVNSVNKFGDGALHRAAFYNQVRAYIVANIKLLLLPSLYFLDHGSK